MAVRPHAQPKPTAQPPLPAPEAAVEDPRAQHRVGDQATLNFREVLPHSGPTPTNNKGPSPTPAGVIPSVVVVAVAVAVAEVEETYK